MRYFDPDLGSRPHTFELNVSDDVTDLAEQDLLLHAVGEADRAADFRPGAAVALRDDVDEILRVMALRIALVRAKVGAVLEARLRDHAASREVLVRAEAEFEVGLDRLCFLDEAGEPDGPVCLRIPDLNDSGFQEECGLEEAQLESPTDDLSEEAGGVECARFRLVDHDGAVAQEMHHDAILGQDDRAMSTRPGLANAVIRQVTFFVHEAEEEGLAHALGLFRSSEQFGEIEDRALAQRSYPVLARGLLRRAAAGVHLEVDGTVTGLDDVPSLPQVAVHKVANLERRDRDACGTEELSRGHAPVVASDLEAFRLDEVHGLEEIEGEGPSRFRGAEVSAVV